MEDQDWKKSSHGDDRDRDHGGKDKEQSKKIGDNVAKGKYSDKERSNYRGKDSKAMDLENEDDRYKEKKLEHEKHKDRKDHGKENEQEREKHKDQEKVRESDGDKEKRKAREKSKEKDREREADQERERSKERDRASRKGSEEDRDSSKDGHGKIQKDYKADRDMPVLKQWNVPFHDADEKSSEGASNVAHSSTSELKKMSGCASSNRVFPADLLREIFLCLKPFDLLRCRQTCRSWRSIGTEIYFLHRHPPFLLMSLDDGASSLQDLSTMERHTIHHGHHVCNCTKGYLLTHSRATPSSIALVNPLSGRQIPLPPVDTLIKGIVSDPLALDFTVFIIHGSQKKLGFCQVKDKDWTYVPQGSNYMDLIIHNGEVYASDVRGTVFCMDGKLTVLRKIKNPMDDESSTWNWLASVGDELWIVFNVVNQSTAKAGTKLVVYKLRESIEKDWDPVMDFGKEVIFLGFDDPAAVSSTTGELCQDYPALKTEKGEFYKGIYLIGVFPLQSVTGLKGLEGVGHYDITKDRLSMVFSSLNRGTTLNWL